LAGDDVSMARHSPAQRTDEGKGGLLKALGPGLITGASDDDPSGIGTYSQAGAQFGFGIGWTLLFTYPLMVAIQEISARIGRTTGHGIAGNLCRHYPAWLLYSVVSLLFAANAINIGADLGAMGDAVKLVCGGVGGLYVAAFAVFCAATEVFISYQKYASYLRWLTLVLLAYVATLAIVHVPWGEALQGLFIPRITWTSDFFTMLVAIFGTTISPYLFFWQASGEVEEQNGDTKRRPLKVAPVQAKGAFRRIRIDTLVGMALSNIVSLAIVITTAATLHANGKTDVATSAQAAEALKPIAGEFAGILFALGIIGTGLLSVPVLAGSAAYGVAEAFHLPWGLSRKPSQAKAFYGVIIGATLIGVGVNFTPIDPVNALFWTAVINGVVAVPVMVVMMMMTARKEIMGDFPVGDGLRWLGWVATAAMALCVLGMLVTALIGGDS
jgi:NRAMP (natural resistance-associated macrophage protein)-like metal ion transporter